MCNECHQVGQSIEPLLKQSKFGKLPIPTKTNEEIAKDFAGPFKMLRSSKKKHLTVSIDIKTGWQDAKFLRAPTTIKGIKFLQEYIADNSVLKEIRTSPGTAFTSQ